MYDSEPADLIEFANRWRELGAAIADQVAKVFEDPTCGSCWNEGAEHGVNPAAIEMAYQRLWGLNEGIDEALSEFLKSVAE